MMHLKNVHVSNFISFDFRFSRLIFFYRFGVSEYYFYFFFFQKMKLLEFIKEKCLLLKLSSVSLDVFNTSDMYLNSHMFLL